jgi:hypothetical protein
MADQETTEDGKKLFIVCNLDLPLSAYSSLEGAAKEMDDLKSRNQFKGRDNYLHIHIIHLKD